jgi:hypothetical protein
MQSGIDTREQTQCLPRPELPRALSPKHNPKVKSMLDKTTDKFNSSLPLQLQRLPKLKTSAGCCWYIGT